MGCCTNLAHLLRTVGVAHLLEDQPTLWFMTPDRRVSQFRADPWPAPFHLGRALLSAHYLSAGEKLRIVYGLGMMLREPPDADPPLLDWLLSHRQTNRTIDRFWGVVLTSALNETVDRCGLRYARKVFRDGFVAHRDAFTVQVPRVPLGRLYGDELRAWIDRYGVEVRLNAGVKCLASPPVATGGLWGVTMRDGATLPADHVVLAVPFDRVPDLLPEPLAADPFFARVKGLQPSPITSVHLWYDRPVLPRPHLVLVDCLGQWAFDRGGGYVQVVVSAARPLRGLGRDEVQRRVADELARLVPAAGAASLLRAKVVTEHTATFSAVPGVDRFRPPQRTPVPGLALAGDWTDTGWPATMEGAVRSGYRAAEAVLAERGRAESLVRPDLGSA
jgi:squalene-associated FAD-dependent desaturase